MFPHRAVEAFSLSHFMRNSNQLGAFLVSQMKHIDVEAFWNERPSVDVAPALYEIAAARQPADIRQQLHQNAARAGVMWKAIVMEYFLPHALARVKAAAKSSVFLGDFSISNTLVSCSSLQHVFDAKRNRDCRALT